MLSLHPSPLLRHALLALAPLALLAGLALSLTGAILFFVQAPTQDRLEQAMVLHEAARRTQARHHTIWKAEEALRTVWQDLPPRAEFTSLIMTVSDLAARERVTIPGMTYQFQKAEDGLALKASITFHAAGEYAGIRRLIHQLETSGPYIFVESLDVSRTASGPKSLSAPVTFNVRLVTFLRLGAHTEGAV